MTRTRLHTQSAVLSVALGLVLASAAVGAETLLVERVQQETRVALPARGLSMAQVPKGDNRRALDAFPILDHVFATVAQV